MVKDNNTAKGKIFIAYHKPFKMLKGDNIVPVHAGRACTKERKGDKKNTAQELSILKEMVGDDTGETISHRNNEYSECSVLYWIWKNENIKNLDYVGFFQYRRQLILNSYFSKAKNNLEKRAYKCVHFKNINKNFGRKIGLTEENILKILATYDCIVPLSTDLEALGISSIYEDWVRKIPGSHVGDLVELEKIMAELHPELSQAFGDYLNSSKKLMYQIFITTPKILEEYCDWLFNILFEIDKRIDTRLYSVNGKRTMGYIAEILYGFYFTYMKNILKIKECGVTFIDE